MVADECRIQHEPNAVYHWSRKGQTPVIRINRDKRNNVSIYGGLSLNRKRVIAHYCQKQRSEETIKFFNKIKTYQKRLTKETKKSLPILVVLDNARWHKGEKIREWLRNNPGVLKLLNFPPYSPECNPQEKVWRSLKQHLAKLRLYEYSWQEIVSETKLFLRNRKFDYRFV